MINLVLSICFSAVIVLILRGFTRYRIDSFQAIVVNYLTCTVIGLGSTSSGQLMMVLHWNGTPYAIGLGMLFIGLFYLIARTTQTMGVTVTSVAQKLSFVIPVIVGIAVFKEEFNFVKLSGFALAMLAVFFVSMRSAGIAVKGSIWMPALVFFGSGVCDLMIKIIESEFLGPVTMATFTAVLFGTAFLSGMLATAAGFITKSRRPDLRSLAAGVLLGIPNYGSIYFLVAALRESGLESSQVFPVNNVGVILLSAAAAALIYKERLNRMQGIGLALALASILILMTDH